MVLTEKFKSILWEYDISKLDIDSSLVTQRVLNLGDKELTDFWLNKVWRKKAKKLFLENAKFLDKKSYNYWKIILWVEDKKINNKKTMYEKLNTPIFSRSFK